MEQDEPVDEDAYTIGVAVLFCFGYLQLIYWATRPLAREEHNAWQAWLLAMLFTLLPIALTFITLYASAWQHAWPKSKRVVGSMLASCAIFGACLFLLGWLMAISLTILMFYEPSYS